MSLPATAPELDRQQWLRAVFYLPGSLACQVWHRESGHCCPHPREAYGAGTFLFPKGNLNAVKPGLHGDSSASVLIPHPN